MLPPMPSKRLFISWSRESHGVAQAMRNLLQAAVPGLVVWLSTDAIKAGQNWRDEIDLALRESDAALLCLGPSALGSPWVAYEAGAIGHQRPLMPVLLQLQPDDLPPTLQSVQAIAAFEPDGDAPLGRFDRRLVDAVAGLTGLPVGAEQGPQGPLDDALRHFHVQRVDEMLERLRQTRQRDTLVFLMERVDGAPGISPVKLAESKLGGAVLLKKADVVLSVFFLIELGLMQVSHFDGPAQGALRLTADGRRLLRAFKLRGL